MRRLDNDSDGLVTAKEFRLGLKRLKVRDAKKWTIHMVKKFIALFDTKQRGLLSISDLVSFVRGDGKRSADLKSRIGTPGESRNPETFHKQSSLSDDEEMEEIFSRQKALSDQTLFKKVSQFHFAVSSISKSFAKIL